MLNQHLIIPDVLERSAAFASEKRRGTAGRTGSQILRLTPLEVVQYKSEFQGSDNEGGGGGGAGFGQREHGVREVVSRGACQ